MFGRKAKQRTGNEQDQEYKEKDVEFMNWLNKMERKFGRYAIPNLMNYIIALYVTGFVLNMSNPDFYDRFLSLDASAVLRGQIWRVLTFIIQPPSNSIIWVFFALMLYHFIGNQLEMTWGTFRFNVYFFPV